MKTKQVCRIPLFAALVAALLFALMSPAVAQTWENVGPGGCNCSWEGMVVDPADADIATVVTQRGNCYTTTDGGQNWTFVGGVDHEDSFDDSACADMTRFAGVGKDYSSWDNAIWITTDGGATWTMTALDSDLKRFYSVALTADPNIVYIAGRIGDKPQFLKSIDGGATFTMTDLSGISLGNPKDIKVSANDPDLLYICGERDNASSEPEAFGLKSTDGGVTWTDISANIDTDSYKTPSTVTIDPSDDQHIVMAGTHLWQSFDGGATFYQDSHGGFSYAHSVAIDPTNPANMYVGSEGPIFVTKDGGATWTEHEMTNMHNLNGKATMVIAPSDPSTIWHGRYGPGGYG